LVGYSDDGKSPVPGRLIQIKMQSSVSPDLTTESPQNFIGFSRVGCSSAAARFRADLVRDSASRFAHAWQANKHGDLHGICLKIAIPRAFQGRQKVKRKRSLDGKVISPAA